MPKTKVLAVGNAAFFLVHLGLSQLTQLRVFSAQTIGDVSNRYPTLFTPAGITFAIWGPIYLGLTVFCGYHLLRAFRAAESHPANADTQRLGYLFMVNQAATAAWTLVWVQEMLGVSVLLMGIQLVTLALIQSRLGIFNPGRSAASRWCTQIPLSLYFGWICVATIANISAALVGWEWNGGGLTAGTWALVMVGVATALTLFLVQVRRNPYLGLVTAWALWGIILKHQQIRVPASPAIQTAAGLGIVLVLLGVAYRFYASQSRSA